jgi:hypothetical protein
MYRVRYVNSGVLWLMTMTMTMAFGDDYDVST